jgi:hypothetical protein
MQDAYYSGGIAQYSSTGKVNIEFEAKLYKDIICDGCGYAFAGGAPQDIIDSYFNWVIDLAGDPNNITLTDYQYWLGKFNQYNPAYSSATSPSLSTPMLLNCLI